MHFSLSSAAFTPLIEIYQYQSHGRYLIHQGSGNDRTHYKATVFLPQGVQVIDMTTFWLNDDSTSANGYAYLCCTDNDV